MPNLRNAKIGSMTTWPGRRRVGEQAGNLWYNVSI